MEIAATQPIAHVNQPSAPGVDLAENRKLAQAVRALNEAGTAGPQRAYSLALDSLTKRPVIHIVDTNTQDVIEQIPSQYILEIAADLGRKPQTYAATDNVF